MIPVVDHQDYRIAINPENNSCFLLFHTTYDGNAENVVIRLPNAPWEAYQKHGHKEFTSWIKRINEDYQVGRFSKDNPRIYTDYQLATAEEINAIDACFKSAITLIEQEALRLLFSLQTTYSNLAISCISEILADGKCIPIEIFCLMFRFYERDKPLLNHQGNQLIAKAHASEALIRLQQNPVAGCPDSATIVLGLLTLSNDPYKAFFQLAHLHSLKNEFNFRYLQDRLNFYIKQIDSVKDNEDDMPYMENLVHQFRREFPPHEYFNLVKDKEYLPHWLFMEQALSWERDCHDCLEQCFLTENIKLNYEDVQNLLHLPSGTDCNWHRYSVGQELKYHNENPQYFTKETVKKPKMPINGYQGFVLNVWQHYFRFFMPDIHISRDQLNKVLTQFIQTWNE